MNQFHGISKTLLLRYLESKIRNSKLESKIKIQLETKIQNPN